MTAFRPLGDWAALGVRALNGAPLPKADINAALVSGASRHFLVYGNYDALLSYNCAHAYAVSVALLADRIGGIAAPAAKPAGRPSRPPASQKPQAHSSARPVAAAAGEAQGVQGAQ